LTVSAYEDIFAFKLA